MDPDRAAARRIKGRIAAGLARANLRPGDEPRPVHRAAPLAGRRRWLRLGLGLPGALLLFIAGRIFFSPVATPPGSPALAERRPLTTPVMATPSPGSSLSADAGGFLDRHRQVPLASLFSLGVHHVVLDPGHGGRDPGTVGPQTGILEKDVALDVCMNLARELREEQGLTVELTRSGDETLGLRERALFANHRGADLFVSVHVNSFGNPEFRGIETYYLGFPSDADAEATAALENVGGGGRIGEFGMLMERLNNTLKNEESARLARALQSHLYGDLRSLRGRGVRDYGVRQAPFLVLLDTKMPSVLAEVSLMNDPQEELRLTQADHRREIARALAQGLREYVEGIEVPTLQASSAHRPITPNLSP